MEPNIRQYRNLLSWSTYWYLKILNMANGHYRKDYSVPARDCPRKENKGQNVVIARRVQCFTVPSPQFTEQSLVVKTSCRRDHRLWNILLFNPTTDFEVPGRISSSIVKRIKIFGVSFNGCNRWDLQISDVWRLNSSKSVCKKSKNIDVRWIVLIN